MQWGALLHEANMLAANAFECKYYCVWAGGYRLDLHLVISGLSRPMQMSSAVRRRVSMGGLLSTI